MQEMSVTVYYCFLMNIHLPLGVYLHNITYQNSQKAHNLIVALMSGSFCSHTSPAYCLYFDALIHNSLNLCL